MSKHHTNETRQSLPQRIVLSAAEVGRVAGGVSSQPVPPYALPGEPCVRTVTFSRLTMNPFSPFYGHGYFFTVQAADHDLLSH